jgi:ABC-type transport system substrate-binding protein
MAGQLIAVGIRASIETQTFAAYRKTQRDGKLELLVAANCGGGLPDVAQTLNFFFADDTRDYHGRPDLVDLAAKANSEMDGDVRKSYTRKLLDEITAMHYLVPLTTTSDIVVHRAEVRLDKGIASIGYGYTMSDVSWR